MTKALEAHYEVNRVATMIDMSPRWVKERIKSGEIEGFRLGGRIVVTAKSLNAFMENRRMTRIEPREDEPAGKPTGRPKR